MGHSWSNACDCGHEPTEDRTSTSTGYAITKEGEKYCYDCAAEQELNEMIELGSYVLYVGVNDSDNPTRFTVTNWTGRNAMPIRFWKIGHHNMSGSVIHFWFIGPDDKVWHGSQYGEGWGDRMTEPAVGYYCHVKRTKYPSLDAVR